MNNATRASAVTECTDCRGTGQIAYYGSSASDEPTSWHHCDSCSGCGTVTDYDSLVWGPSVAAAADVIAIRVAS